MSREAMQQALEFCEFAWRDVQMNDYAFEQLEQTITALRAALAEQAQPVAWVEQIIDDLHALHDTEMIQEIDSGDALIRLDDAIAVVEEARDRHTTPPAPVVPQPMAELPPLPEPNVRKGDDLPSNGGFWTDLYDADQMRDAEYGRKLNAAIAALRAALAEQKCPCGDRPADQCPGEWEPGCDLGANEKYAKVYEEKEPK